MLGATVDYSSVLAGAIKLQNKIRAGTKQALAELATVSTTNAIKYLKESYKTKPGRPDFARTGTLERAVFTAVNLGTVFPGGFMSGTGDIDQLYAMAPYWDMVEEGSQEYIGDEITGIWQDSSGKSWGPRGNRYPKDKFVGMPGIDMTIKTPIQAHNFYKDASEDMRKAFTPTVMKYVLGVLG